MFIEERHQRILQKLREQGRVEVVDLSAAYDASEDTIRRDLRILESKGWLKRTYGGAILPEQMGVAPDYNTRETLRAGDKEQIAKTAADLLSDGDTILLDGSTTVARMVPYLGRFKRLKAITNSIAIAEQIVKRSLAIELYFLGGLVSMRTANTAGTEVVQALERLSVDKVFLGACAITLDWGLSTPEIDESLVKKTMIEAGREVYILADSGKFGHRSLAQIGPLNDGYTIITDSELNNEVYQEYLKNGVRVVRTGVKRQG